MQNFISYHRDSLGIMFLNADLQGLTFGYVDDHATLNDAMTLDQAIAAVNGDMVDVSDLSELSVEELESLTKWLYKHGADSLALYINTHMI